MKNVNNRRDKLGSQVLQRIGYCDLVGEGCKYSRKYYNSFSVDKVQKASCSNVVSDGVNHDNSVDFLCVELTKSDNVSVVQSSDVVPLHGACIDYNIHVVENFLLVNNNIIVLLLSSFGVSAADYLKQICTCNGLHVSKM